jgi:SAM-dependent methyltransferase
MESSEWFEAWFDTKFYHMLYRHRDENEARNFLSKLLRFLNLSEASHIQDLACGTGRHSIFLNSLGYDVTGLDLSANSIAEAKKHENDRLHFHIHDMRDVFQENSFEAIFNLFTSFGYFADESDNLEVIKAVHSGLKPGGLFILDYLNSSLTLKQLPGHETKTVDDYRFEISKELSDHRIVKKIQIIKEGRSMSYTESIYPYSELELTKMLEQVGFKIKHCFGSYDLKDYSEANSERLILIAQKIQG